MRTTWSFQSAGQIQFGVGIIQQIGEFVRSQGWESAFLVTDPYLVTAGIMDIVTQPLASANVHLATFVGGEPEPSLQVAKKAIKQAGKFEPDVIIGLGGGSNMDLAKVTAVAHTYGGKSRDYFGFDKVPGPTMPVICVPTTAGTGSEVSHSAVLTDTENEMKVSTLSQHLRPVAAIIDPELTLTCPRQVTAESGIDALTHAIEAYTAKDYFDLADAPPQARAYEGRFPLSDILAEKAISLIGKNLRTAVVEPGNIDAREAMCLAATLAGMAFSNAGVALVHALEYPIGGKLHCSHGAGNGMLLPYVMKYNLPSRVETFANIARLLGCDVSLKTDRAAAESAIDAIVQLRKDIGIPERIRDLGGTPDQLPVFAAKSIAIDRLVWLNPRAATESDLLGILESAF